MKQFLLSLLLCMSVEAFAAPSDTLFVCISAERMDAYPMEWVKDMKEDAEGITLVTSDDVAHRYCYVLIDSISDCAPDSLPKITQFKFNNKYNGQVFTDVFADIGNDHVIKATIGAVGKWLTPSFQLSDTLAQAYVDGVEQHTKKSRQRFDHPLTYTVARPGWQVLCFDKAADTLSWRPYGNTYQVQIDWLSERTTNVPIVNLTTADNVLPSSKTVYVDATLAIDGSNVWPDLPEVDMQVRGRGNTSWSSDPTAKNPYRLKFPSGLKPFGLTRGKNWVLLANAQKGSMMTGAIGMKAAQLMGCAATNHMVPVELYINGDYRGSYTFTEKIGLHNNSIDLENESRAVLLELDTYSDPTKFRTEAYNMPVNIKAPEDSLLNAELSSIHDAVNAFFSAVSNRQDVTDLVDVNYLAAYLSLNELIGNYEINHPKSVFLYNEDLKGGSPYVFGPVWDLDWAYGYADRRAYYVAGYTDNFYTAPTHTYTGGTNAFRADLFWKHLRYDSESVDRACYVLWTRFYKQGGLDELLDYVDDYYQFVASSFNHNATLWGDGTTYATLATQAKNWLQRRVTHIYSKLTPYELTAEELDEPTHWQPSQASADNVPSDIAYVKGQVSSVKGELFSVYTLQGICLKRNATFNSWREGLSRGIYIVNGHRVLVP